MSAKGCLGLQYLKELDEITVSTAATPTLGFWLYAAIIGGAIFGAALILVVVHAVFTVRPVQLETMRVCILA